MPASRIEPYSGTLIVSPSTTTPEVSYPLIAKPRGLQHPFANSLPPGFRQRDNSRNPRISASTDRTRRIAASAVRLNLSQHTESVFHRALLAFRCRDCNSRRFRGRRSNPVPQRRIPSGPNHAGSLSAEQSRRRRIERAAGITGRRLASAYLGNLHRPPFAGRQGCRFREQQRTPAVFETRRCRRSVRDAIRKSSQFAHVRL